MPDKLHFGDPFGEQVAYEAGRGLAPVPDLGVISVSGPDRLQWLTTLSSQVVTDLEEGQSRELLFLDPNGRISFAAGIIDREGTAWLFTPGQFEADLVHFLESMKFMNQVEVDARGADFAGFSTVNATARQMPGVLVWEDPWPGVEPGGARYYQGDHPGAHLKLRLYAVPQAAVPAFIESWVESGAKLVGTLAAEATRVASWRPSVSAEVDERTLPAELDWLRTGVHTDKGCYCGQESVARILNLGRPPRRLTLLQLDGSLGDLPEPGDAVMATGRQVGVVTSVARHNEMGPIALALLQRSLDPNVPLLVGDIAAAQEVIVPVEGRADISPEVRPGAELSRLAKGGHESLGLR